MREKIFFKIACPGTFCVLLLLCAYNHTWSVHLYCQILRKIREDPKEMQLLENQVGEQDHAVANIWRIQVGKLATQQIGDELQLQENEFNIAILLCPK